MTYDGDLYHDDARYPTIASREPKPVKRILPLPTIICSKCGTTFELRDEERVPAYCERCR